MFKFLNFAINSVCILNSSELLSREHTLLHSYRLLLARHLRLLLLENWLRLWLLNLLYSLVNIPRLLSLNWNYHRLLLGIRILHLNLLLNSIRVLNLNRLLLIKRLLNLLHYYFLVRCLDRDLRNWLLFIFAIAKIFYLEELILLQNFGWDHGNRLLLVG